MKAMKANKHIYIKGIIQSCPLKGIHLILSSNPSTWRSGSTFLGSILASVPGTFYHYEPLGDFGVFQINEDPLASIAIRNVKKLLNCDYKAMDRYLRFCRITSSHFTQNRWIRNLRISQPDLDYKPELLQPICKLFPWHAMKVLRLRLATAERLLQDQE